jgi:hypothetical protein
MQQHIQGTNKVVACLLVPCICCCMLISSLYMLLYTYYFLVYVVAYLLVPCNNIYKELISIQHIQGTNKYAATYTRN